MYSATYIWAKIIGYLEQQLGAIAVSAWLDDAEVVELNDTQLTLYSPSDFRREIILRDCKSYIETAFREHFGMQVKLVVLGDEELKSHRQEKKNDSPWVYNGRYNFENFIADPLNELPLKAAEHIADHPGDCVYNPLYLYGIPGVGKTHLLYAIANRIAQNTPHAKVVYVKGDQFTNELIQSIMQGDTTAFRKKYREADVLLVDDIQFIAGKEATQEEFFHTFNYLYELNKQIVITSDRKPGDMPTLEDRLRGRFGTGVMVEIKPPDLETRQRIVACKAESLQLQLEGDMVQYIAQTLCQNVRQIEGGLRKLLAYRDLAGVAMTRENITRILEDMEPDTAHTAVTADTVVRYVCRYYGVDEEQLMGSQRCRNITAPRQVAMFLVRHLTEMSLVEIGQYFHRDHGTVLHSIKKVEALSRNRESGMEDILQDLRASIEGNL